MLEKLKLHATLIVLLDRLEHYSPVFLRLVLGLSLIVAAADCLWHTHFAPSSRWLLAFFWGSLLLKMIVGAALLIGLRTRDAALTAGTGQLLFALLLLLTSRIGFSLATLHLAASAGAFTLAARKSHPWSLDYFFSGEWLPIAMPPR